MLSFKNANKKVYGPKVVINQKIHNSNNNSDLLEKENKP